MVFSTNAKLKQLNIRMLLSENYLHYVKDIEPKGLVDYEVISIEDLALMPRKLSISDASSNGIASHDSGHDSYLDDGTGYSGDDEESVRCDICSNGVDSSNHARENGCHKRKSKRRSKRNKNRRKTKKKLEEEKGNGIVQRELPRTDNFEFEGEKKVEMKWTLECFLDTNLLPKLRRVIIDRGREEDLGMDNLMVFDESSRYAEIQSWRQNTLIQLGQRNSKEINYFDMLPTHLSCDSCIELRQKEIQMALKEGKSLKLSENPTPYMMGHNRERGKSEESKALWRKKVVYDLKLNNCRALACIRAVRRERVITTSYRFGKSPKRHNGVLDKVDEEDWEVYEIISDDEFLCQMNGL